MAVTTSIQFLGSVNRKALFFLKFFLGVKDSNQYQRFLGVKDSIKDSNQYQRFLGVKDSKDSTVFGRYLGVKDSNNNKILPVFGCQRFYQKISIHCCDKVAYSLAAVESPTNLNMKNI